MSRIFLSHSSANNAEAIAIRDWMIAHGWDDLFLDLDPERGLKAGERWQKELKRAAERCEMVVILISPAWVGSPWCRTEFLLAQTLNKRIFAVIVEPTQFSDLPTEIRAEWQITDLTAGARDYHATVLLPGGKSTEVALSTEGLDRLGIGLVQSGLDPKHFAWPPATDPDRVPYRGLLSLEGDDAGIFFGREAPIIDALDRLRGLRDAPPPRLLVILGASGAGKSSFLRAGLLPRLARDDRHFLALPIIRPERVAISGEMGLLRAVEGAVRAVNLSVARADLRTAIEGGATQLRALLSTVAQKATPTSADTTISARAPTLVLSIDQGEELFLAEGQEEARPFLSLLRDLVTAEAPAVIALLTIRSDNYERLQLAKELEGVRQQTLSLPPMPRGSYAEVIKGPGQRLEGTPRAFMIDDALVDALLTDLEVGGAKDALPLLAFTLERLYGEYGGTGHLKLEHYEKLGRIAGSIEAAVERAIKTADADPKVPKDKQTRLALLRSGFIPWLAGIDPDTGEPRRRVARLSEIPGEARPLVDLLVEQRLLSTDVAKGTKEKTIEPAHEALLRQWGLLQGWLKEDAPLLSVLDGIQRAARDWEANGKATPYLGHAQERLRAAERLLARPDFAAALKPTDKDYLGSCQRIERAAQARARRMAMVAVVATLGIGLGLLGWLNQSFVQETFNWYFRIRPYMRKEIQPYVLTGEKERALKPKDSFKECAEYCPEMIVIAAGEFMMGRRVLGQHKVTISQPFAASKFHVRFADWDACVSVGGCPQVRDFRWGRGTKPVIDVSWDDAQQYVAWLSRMTGRPYRLLTEAEWEYAARAGTTTAYSWGNKIGEGNANCKGCGSPWDDRETSPAGSFKPNAFGLYDMAGNVAQWVQDCLQDGYNDETPTDGSAWTSGDCIRRVVRGGHFRAPPRALWSAARGGNPTGGKGNALGFRVGRTLSAEPGALTPPRGW
jgi:formylglycine-generating enzyme required for sulfatase activity